MDIIEKIREKLGRYPQIKFEESDNSITILPVSDDGFEVALYVDDSHSREPYQVCFNGWHEYFSDPTEALECFVFGLSDECRLRQHSRNGKAYRWTVEFRRDGHWHEESTTSHLWVPFWKSSSVEYFQNRLITRTDENG